MEIVPINTSENKQLLDIFPDIQRVVVEKKWKNGVLTIFTPHTTSAITINENADPDVRRDILSHMQKLVPRDKSFLHIEGNSDSHILSSIFCASTQVIIEESQMVLGTWQTIFFAEFDGPRNRRVYLKFIGE